MCHKPCSSKILKTQTSVSPKTSKFCRAAGRLRRSTRLGQVRSCDHLEIPRSSGGVPAGSNGYNLQPSGCFQIIHLNRVFHYKPSIWGYHHLKETPICWSSDGPEKFPMKLRSFSLFRFDQWWFLGLTNWPLGLFAWWLQISCFNQTCFEHASNVQPLTPPKLEETHIFS